MQRVESLQRSAEPSEVSSQQSHYLESVAGLAQSFHGYIQQLEGNNSSTKDSIDDRVKINQQVGVVVEEYMHERGAEVRAASSRVWTMTIGQDPGISVFSEQRELDALGRVANQVILFSLRRKDFATDPYNPNAFKEILRYPSLLGHLDGAIYLLADAYNINLNRNNIIKK